MFKLNTISSILLWFAFIQVVNTKNIHEDDDIEPLVHKTLEKHINEKDSIQDDINEDNDIDSFIQSNEKGLHELKNNVKKSKEKIEENIKTAYNSSNRVQNLWNSWHHNPSAFQIKIRTLMKLKNRIEDHLQEAAPIHHLATRKQLIDLFKRVINQSEAFIINSIHHFDRALKVGYGSIEHVKKNCEDHVQTLRGLLVNEDRLLNDISALQKLTDSSKEKDSMKNLSSFWSSILESMKGAADELEIELAEPAFDMMLKSGNKANIETVIKVNDAAPGGQNDDHALYGNNRNLQKSHDTGDANQQEDNFRLVDSQNNQYALSKSKDTTIPIEDASLVKDITNVILVAFVFTFLCYMSGLPVMFGYILAGVILGPSGFNIIKNLVQLETLGEFGIFFILYSVGLEFSIEKIKRLWKVALSTSLTLLTVMLILAVSFAYVIGFEAKQCMFVAACASLSSTPLAIKFLNEGSHKEFVQVDPAPTLIGVLIVQDIILGIFIALLPTIANQSDDMDLTSIAKNLSPVIASLLILIALTAFISYIIKHFIVYLVLVAQTEIFLLATISLAFITLLITDFMKLSMELGCFLAGVMMSSSKHHHQLTIEVEAVIHPLKDFFSCLFFTSIGLHVYPSFLTYEVTLLLPVTVIVVFTKFFCSLMVLNLNQTTKNTSTSWLTAAGLAQISEFSFVLGSRARVMGIISREVYLLGLSVTMLSFFAAPLMWKFALQRVKALSLHHL